MIGEAVILAAAGVFLWVARLLARGDVQEPGYRFFRVFWHVMTRRPIPARVAEAQADVIRSEQYVQLKQAGDFEAIQRLFEEQTGEAVDVLTEQDLMELEELAAEAQEAVGPEQELPSNVAVLNIRVIPMCDRVELVESTSDLLNVMITTSAEDGESNRQVLTLLGSKLDVRPHQFTILRGHNKVRKVVQVSGISPEQAFARLGILS
jgi:uncharacterized protein YggU (UPF0235/DUF167 family)